MVAGDQPPSASRRHEVYACMPCSVVCWPGGIELADRELRPTREEACAAGGWFWMRDFLYVRRAACKCAL